MHHACLSKIGRKPPKIIRLPSRNFMASPNSFIRGSSSIFFLAASRISLDGYSIHENTTLSLFSAFTARKKSVVLPCGTSSLQHSTCRIAPHSLKERPAFLRKRAIVLPLVACHRQ